MTAATALGTALLPSAAEAAPLAAGKPRNGGRDHAAPPVSPPPGLLVEQRSPGLPLALLVIG